MASVLLSAGEKNPEVLPNGMILLPVMSSKKKLISCTNGVGVKLIVPWAHGKSIMSIISGSFLRANNFLPPKMVLYWDN